VTTCRAWSDAGARNIECDPSDASAHAYHKAVLQQLLSGTHRRLGDAVLAAQVEHAGSSALPELAITYQLFANPMRLP
jgi:hypothetical protein